PPLPDSPPLGAVWIAGRVTRLEPADATQAASGFAAANPADILLDVGRGTELFELEPVEIRLERIRELAAVPVDEFVAAEPDPFHVDERDLLLHLRHRHSAEIAAVLGVPAGDAQVVRLSRHGAVIRVRRGARTALMTVAFDASTRVASHRPAGHDHPADR